MILVDVSADEREQLEAASNAAYEIGNGRTWKRLQAILLLADGASVATVAETLDCSTKSIYQWIGRWRDGGIAGVRAHTPARPSHYRKSPEHERRVAEVLALRAGGLEWKQIARELGFKTPAGPLLLLRRALEEEQDSE